MSLCESCHAGCCRSFAVPITGADIIRIERESSLTFWDFACRWADLEGRIAGSQAPHFRFEDEPDTPFVICLIHDQSVNVPTTTKCRFLAETPPDDANSLGTARCSVYAHRPLACRSFPTKLNSEGDLAVIYDVPSRGRADDHPIYQLCSRQWETSDVDPLQAVQDLVVARFEMDFFRQVATIWNQKSRPWSVFPDFLRLVYATRVSKAAAHQAEDAGPATIKLSESGRISSRRAA